MAQTTDPTPDSPQSGASTIPPVTADPAAAGSPVVEGAPGDGIDPAPAVGEPAVLDESIPASDAAPASEPAPAPELVSPATPEPVTPASAAPVVDAPTRVLPDAGPTEVLPAAAPAAAAVPPPAPTSATGHVAAQPVVPREVVYVQAPTPPKPRGNRGFGALISFIGALVFGLLYLGAGAVVIALTPGANIERTLSEFALSAAFWVPIGAYAVLSILWALLANRAAWWVHVLGSLIVGALVFAASVGILALMYDVIGMTQEEGLEWIARIASSPFIIAAALLAREVALWFGLAIASRGRRVKARNAEERARFDAEVAEQRAAYERANAF